MGIWDGACFETMIGNTKQRNMADGGEMRGSHGLYLATTTPLLNIPVYHPPIPLEGFIGNVPGSAHTGS